MRFPELSFEDCYLKGCMDGRKCKNKITEGIFVASILQRVSSLAKAASDEVKRAVIPEGETRKFEETSRHKV